MKMAYTPYRGEIEPVTDIRKAEITLHDEYVEVIYSYDYTYMSESGRGPESINSAYLIPKYGLGVSRTESVHALDPDKEDVPMVTFESPCMDAVWIRCKSKKEADNIYLNLRKYLLDNE